MINKIWIRSERITKKNKPGMSLVELIIAMAVFSLIIIALTSMSVGGFSSLDRGAAQNEAGALAQEGIEAVRAIKSRAWNELIYNSSGVQIVNNQWKLKGEGTTDVIGKYTRTITFSDVCRTTGTLDIVDCPGDYTDLFSKKVAVVVSWSSGLRTSTVTREQYLTNWIGHYFRQTDWSGGSGSSIWTTANKYLSDNGNVKVSTAGQVSLNVSSNAPTSSASIDWTYDNAGEYNYDVNTTEFTGTAVQLKDLGGGGSCSGTPNSCSTFSTQPTCSTQIGCSWAAADAGSTVNSSFATTTNPWVYSDWEDSFARVSSGRTGGYIYINFSGRKSTTMSGYYQQSFVSNSSDPTATLSFDWAALLYSAGSLNSFKFYVFVDSAPGAPTIGSEVWSTTVTSVTSFASISNLDVSAKLATPGTHYIKLAIRAIYVNGGTPGTSRGAFDNVVLKWSKSAFCDGTPNSCNTFSTQSPCSAQLNCSWSAAPLYSAGSPTVEAITAFSTSSLVNWSGFTETAATNGGSISYQLSDDNGAHWRYWTGSIWATTTGNNYNDSSVINTNIAKFPTSTGQIKVKAFLTSNGSQLVQLDNVNIAYVKKGIVSCSTVELPYNYYWSFANSTDYTYDTAEIEFASGQAQLKLLDVPGYTAGLWHMDDSSGNFIDSSGYSYDLNNQLGTTGTYSQSGEFSNAVSFDGDGGRYIPTASAPNLSITGPITVEAWVYKTSAYYGVFQPVAGKWDDYWFNFARSYALAINEGNDAVFLVSPNGFTSNSITSNVSVPINQWVHLAGVYDESRLYIFINGVLRGSTAYSSGIYDTTKSDFMIGALENYNSSPKYFTGKIDEVRVSSNARWTSAFTPSSTPYITDNGYTTYPMDSPSVNPKVSFSTTSVWRWTGFTETAETNGGSISYQLSSNGGFTWQYWNGSVWATAGADNYNTAAVIDANIDTFTTSTGQIMFKGFLTSDGSQLVQLNNVDVSYVKNGGLFCGGTGILTSSAIDMGTSSAVSIINWDQDISFCSPDCSIKFQVRTAPDSGGLPGVWTSWYGTAGPGTYFTDYLGSKLDKALNGNRWLQYKTFLQSSGGGNPILREVKIDFQ